VRPTLTAISRSRVTARSGANFRAIAHRGVRSLRIPSSSCSAMSFTFTTPPSIANPSWPRTVCSTSCAHAVTSAMVRHSRRCGATGTPHPASRSSSAHCVGAGAPPSGSTAA